MMETKIPMKLILIGLLSLIDFSQSRAVSFIILIIEDNVGNWKAQHRRWSVLSGVKSLQVRVVKTTKTHEIFVVISE